MPIPLSPRIIDALLLGQGDRRRQLQDFPILVDVWALYAERPGRPHDLLLTPHRAVTAARLAAYFDLGERYVGGDEHDHQVAHLQGIVAARLRLEELWTLVLPSTMWWVAIGTGEEVSIDAVIQTMRFDIELLLDTEVDRENISPVDRVDRHLRSREHSITARPSGERQLIRLGLLVGCLAAAQEEPEGPTIATLQEVRDRLGGPRIAELGYLALKQTIAAQAHDIIAAPLKEYDARRGLIYNVSVNRQTEYATARSVPAIKADAARQLFSITCADIGWAVIDSGIDADHPSFQASPGVVGSSRIGATYDFSDIRAILSRTNLYNAKVRSKLAAKIAKKAPDVVNVEERIEALAEAAARDQPIDWTLAEPLIRRDRPDEPVNPHGTHVAAILGGNWVDKGRTRQLGVCPDIRLYDLRVLGPDAEQTEFAVIAALQFVRHLNSRNGFAVIDGVNLSLSIPHNVRNYACGKTPVCMEAETLAAAGTVVVAAAGNRGYQSFRLADDTSFESYAASSITDPGNAEGVITVGSTHRNWPHTYGVSFFSSRGPTGDGRMKPDILAPGERIDSAVPGRATDAMDGTSMAAPHVSGAAALLMARHRELRGRPAKIKEILCANATDLGRERSFQGHGMVDVLRAIQSI